VFRPDVYGVLYCRCLVGSTPRFDFDAEMVNTLAQFATVVTNQLERDGLSDIQVRGGLCMCAICFVGLKEGLAVNERGVVRVCAAIDKCSISTSD
jgi:uncharacterized protein YuzB (UPF0349 family)